MPRFQCCEPESLRGSRSIVVLIGHSLLAECGATRYTRPCDQVFSARRAGEVFTTGSKSGIHPAHEQKLRLQLTVLDSATKMGDIAKFQAWSLHALKGEMAGKWAISVNGNWRLVFEFDGTDVHLVDYKDYH